MDKQLDIFDVFAGDKAASYNKNIHIDSDIENYYKDFLVGKTFGEIYRELLTKFGERYVHYLQDLQKDLEALVPIDDELNRNKHSRIRTLLNGIPNIRFNNTGNKPVFCASMIPNEFYLFIKEKQERGGHL